MTNHTDIIAGRRVTRRHHIVRDNSDVGLVMEVNGPDASVCWGGAEIRTLPAADLAVLPLPERPYAREICSVLRQAKAAAPSQVRHPRAGTAIAVDFPSQTTYTAFVTAFTALADVYGDRVTPRVGKLRDFNGGIVLWIVLDTSQWVTAGITHDVNTIIDPRTSQPVRICIDANCPRCRWPERWFDTSTRLFGCNKCDYVSTERKK